MKESITREEYWQLVGLLALARNFESKMKDIERATAELLGAEPESENSTYYGHVSDAVYGERGPDDLLRLLKIGVSPPELSVEAGGTA